MTSVMNPELTAIRKKYQNKRDQASQLKMNEEMQQVYDKYGTSMTGGCLTMAIQMVLLFALYPVVYDMESYVPAIKNAAGDVQKFLTIPDLSLSPMQMFSEKSRNKQSVWSFISNSHCNGNCTSCPFCSDTVFKYETFTGYFRTGNG